VSAGTGAGLLVAAVATGYLLGSVPFGLLVSKLAGSTDPRTVGSGNIGATNVTRAGGRGLGVATLALDALKGALPALAFARVSLLAGALAGLAAIAGHCFPAWLRFRGGKGVATFLGVGAALCWPAALVFAAAYAATAAAVRIASVASLAATWASCVTALLLGPQEVAAALLLAALVITWRHRGNLARLRRGEETRMGARP
jgi:glycerol-3-phosphate acyltransferase PlsY